MQKEPVNAILPAHNQGLKGFNFSYGFFLFDKIIKTNKINIDKDMTKKEINPYVTLICTHCEFFKEDDFELEYAAFKVLKSMLQDDRITQVEINAMVEIISRIYS